jgi:S-adenosylmethionine decarboxylase proenzyme
MEEGAEVARRQPGVHAKVLNSMAEAQPLCHNFTFRFSRNGAGAVSSTPTVLARARAIRQTQKHWQRLLRDPETPARKQFLEVDAMEGIHLLGEWYGCPADEPLLTQADALRDLCRQAVNDSGLTIVGDRFFQFEPHGVTGTVLLAESHLAIHTWPESGFVTLDVYVCNYTTDNTQKAERVFSALEAALKPRSKRFQAIQRGGLEIERSPMLADALRRPERIAQIDA